MTALHDVTVRVNSGTAWEMKKGQRVRITFQSIVDFVVFNRDNLTERFDQARTKANQGKIYLSTGDRLISKSNVTMMTIVEDTFKGTHDLQYGMCSECSYTSSAATTTIPAHAGHANAKLHASQQSSATIKMCMRRAIRIAPAIPNFFGIEYKPAILSNSMSWQA